MAAALPKRHLQFFFYLLLIHIIAIAYIIYNLSILLDLFYIIYH